MRREVNDMSVTAEKIYEFLRRIPYGKVVTYGQIAAYLGNRHMARAVGNILHQNPDGKLNPCYKVVNARGELSENYAFGGLEEQKKRLIEDGIEVKGMRVDLLKYKWEITNP